jgi:hypothetical protein
VHARARRGQGSFTSGQGGVRDRRKAGKVRVGAGARQPGRGRHGRSGSVGAGARQGGSGARKSGDIGRGTAVQGRSGAGPVARQGRAGVEERRGRGKAG